jgi:putative oxidoreductase
MDLRMWSERVLSILRIMVGLLFMEHGLAKILDFPHQPTHASFVLLTLNPGLQGLLELVGGLLLALVYSLASLALSSRVTWRLLISW